MKAQKETAGETASRTGRINTERVERWRKLIAKRIKELENFRKTKLGFEVRGDALEQLRMCANAECITMEDLVIQFLIKTRKNCEVRYERPDFHSAFYDAEQKAWHDTCAEQNKTKRELNYYDREVVKDAVSFLNDSISLCFRSLDEDEKKSLIAFYKPGDYGLRSAILRALHYGLEMSSPLARG